MGTKLGESFTNSADATEFVRDPLGELGSLLIVPFEVRRSIPAGAKFTGYTYGSVRLWVDPANSNRVFLVAGIRIEQWGRAHELIGCD